MLTRADTGQINFETEKIDVSELALEVVERLTPLARQKGLQLIVGELPELEINGNRLYLTRMISNLVDNAIKYTAGSGRRVQIETGNVIGPAQYEVKAGVKWMWLRVSDDGPGIAAEHLPYLFDRFYKVDKARATGETPDPNIQSETRGSGLGLAIVQLVAQTHGGHVKVESQVGKGTNFIVWLPLSS
jgi:signal transduction histidine kinase